MRGKVLDHGCRKLVRANTHREEQQCSNAGKAPAESAHEQTGKMGSRSANKLDKHAHQACYTGCCFGCMGGHVLAAWSG
jgi:hypothetical protein